MSLPGYAAPRRLATILAAFALGLMLWGLPPSAPLARADSACAAPGTAPYLHTCGTRIVDATGATVVLRAVNWYGFDSNDFVAGGLRYQTYQAIVDRIKGLGFNALRIPFSNELVERDPIVSNLGPICVQTLCLPNSGADAIRANPSLFGLDALTILKTIVDYAGQQGLYVILDDHRSQAAWGPQEDGLWYTAQSCPPGAAPFSCYSAQSWLDDWATLGRLFQSDPNVTGMDLRNEPHAAHQPSTCADYMAGTHWGACGGQNTNPATDWPAAATQAGDALLSLNPHWLMFVEGISSYPQGDGSFSGDGWGENLQGVLSDPVVFTVPNQLVYSPHDYRWDQTNDTAANMDATWTRAFGFVAVPGQSYSAPLWLGEFGTCSNANTCFVDAPSLNSSGWWFSTLVSYLDNPPGGITGPLSWGYWPIDGTFSDSWSYSNPNAPQWQTCYGQRETYGVLGLDWTTLTAPLLISLLNSSPSATPSPTNSPTTTPSLTPTDSPTPSPTASATAPGATASVTASATVSATATGTLTATTTATLTGTPTATGTSTGTMTAAPSSSAPPTGTPLPSATTPAPTPVQWSTFQCAPYTLTPTPAPPTQAPPTATPTNTPLPPTATATATPPPPTLTPAPTFSPRPPAPTATPTARPKPRPRPVKKPPRKPAPPALAVLRGSALARAILLDVRLLLDRHGRLTGWLRYDDRRKGKGLALSAGALHSAVIDCSGALRGARITARLGDRHHVYDAVLSFTIDRHRAVRFTVRLGRSYALTAALSGSAGVTCPPPPRRQPARHASHPARHMAHPSHAKAKKP